MIHSRQFASFAGNFLIAVSYSVPTIENTQIATIARTASAVVLEELLQTHEDFVVGTVAVDVQPVLELPHLLDHLGYWTIRHYSVGRIGNPSYEQNEN